MVSIFKRFGIRLEINDRCSVILKISILTKSYIVFSSLATFDRKIFDRSNFRNETWYYFFAWIFSHSTTNFFFNKSFVTLHHPHRQSRQSVVGNFSSIRGTMVRRLTRRESEWEEKRVAREGRHRCRENTRRVWRPRGDTFFSKGGGLTICRQCFWNEEGRAEMRVTDLNIGRERERERKREDRRGRPRL